MPTGLGKTAAVVLAWLWNHVINDPLSRGVAEGRGVFWPRWLVYCLPMRTLVEQTRDEVFRWIKHLIEKSADLDLSPEAQMHLRWLAVHSPVVLMGGEELDDARRDWDIHPERPAILIGTQDMLLSRALNRGYGMSRHRWPMHFALINHDALWVLDETQLMGVGVETSAQFDAFRRMFAESCPGIATSPPALTWWMSATLDAQRLATVDQFRPLSLPRLELSDADRAHPSARDRLRAIKSLDYKVSYRRALELQFRLLARTLTGEIERYVPFMTR